MMSRLVTLFLKLCEIRSDIGEGQLSRLASALTGASIKFTIPSPVLRVLAQVDRRDTYGCIAPESLQGGLERRRTGEHRLVA